MLKNSPLPVGLPKPLPLLAKPEEVVSCLANVSNDRGLSLKAAPIVWSLFMNLRVEETEVVRRGVKWWPNYLR